MKPFICLIISFINFNCRSDYSKDHRGNHRGISESTLASNEAGYEVLDSKLDKDSKHQKMIYEIRYLHIRSEDIKKEIIYSDYDRSQLSSSLIQILQEVAGSEEKLSNDSIGKEAFPSLSGSYIVSIEFKNIESNTNVITFLNLDKEGDIIIKRYSESVEDQVLNDYIKEILRKSKEKQSIKN